jgi:hypothetical protein
MPTTAIGEGTLNPMSLFYAVSHQSQRSWLQQQLAGAPAAPLAPPARLLVTGRLHYAMKKTFREGTCELSFEPLSFIGWLLALIPPPRFHMLRYAGVLGPGAKLRQQVVPAVPAQSQRAPVQLTWVEAGQPVSQVRDDASAATRHPWSMLLKHVFAVDVTVCVTCGGAMRLLSIATTPKAIGRALYRAALGPQPPPPIARQRVAEPQLSLAFA